MSKTAKILLGLLANCGKSDREIAKILGISNTTMSKRRRKLEREGYIKEYTFLPDLSKIGLEVIVFSFSSTTDLVPEENTNFFKVLSQNHPEILCLFEDHDGVGTNWFGVTVHRNYDEFVALNEKIQKEYAYLRYMPHVETKRLVFHTNKLFPIPFSLRHLEKMFQPIKTLDHTH